MSRSKVSVGYTIFGVTNEERWIGPKYGNLEHAQSAAKQQLNLGADRVWVEEVRIEYTYDVVWRAAR